jgi:hypothetical protein
MWPKSSRMNRFRAHDSPATHRGTSRERDLQRTACALTRRPKRHDPSLRHAFFPPGLSVEGSPLPSALRIENPYFIMKQIPHCYKWINTPGERIFLHESPGVPKHREGRLRVAQ